jgi:hypothetical protein
MAPTPIVLSNPREKNHCHLVSKKELSRDIRVFHFDLLSSDQVLGLAIGTHPLDVVGTASSSSRVVRRSCCSLRALPARPRRRG